MTYIESLLRYRPANSLLALEAATHGRPQGHHRRLERIYGMKRYLNQKALKYGKADMEFSEALEGPVERWNINV